MPQLRTSPTARLLLGSHDAAQQLRAEQALLGLVVYLGFALIQHLEVLLGFIGPAASWALTTWTLGGGAMFYVVIRSGLNRARVNGVSLTVEQSLWATTGVAWSYGITGPARGAILPMLLLIIVFGMFAVTPRQARLIAGAGLAELTAVIVWKAISDPARYPPGVEAVHLAFLLIVLMAVWALSVHVAKMRSSLQRQRTELEAALERINALATHDELTGLPNRRAALERIAMEFAARDRQPPMMSVALIDIDHFKRINDSYGHAAGDAVLRSFARSAQASLRMGDMLARWGGEEFLLVMPVTETAAALGVLARLRELVRDEAHDDIAPGLAITFSAGLAACTRAADLDGAIQNADAAMYRAKKAGRDRTIGPDNGAHAGTARAEALLETDAVAT